MSAGRYVCSYCKEDFHTTCQNLCCPIGYHSLKSRGEDLDGVEGHDDPFELLLHRHYERGLVFAQEAFAKHVTDMAGTAFAKGDDKLATFLRDNARMLDASAKTARAVWTRKYK